MKILIISINNHNIPHPVYPLGVDYVAASIRSDHEVRILDLNVHREEGSVGREVADFQPDVVGISIRNIDNTDITAAEGFILRSRGLVEEVRRAGGAKVVLGGSGFSILPAEIMEVLGADYGLIGEGERFPRLLEALEKGEDVNAIPGLVAKGSPTVYPQSWPEPITREISLPGPALDYYLGHGGIMNLQTKRGCPFQCAYCTYPLLEGRKLRLFDPVEIAREAATLEAAGAKFLFIVDSIFNSDFDHNLELARAFRRVGLSIPWGAFLAPLPGPRDYFQEMARAGLTHVEFGTDSLCPQMLKNYRKPFTVSQVFAAHEAALEAGLHVAHYLLLGGPGESEETLGQTLSSAEKLQKTVIFFFGGIRIYPNTLVYRAAIESGQISPGQNLVEPVYYHSPDLGPDRIKEMVSTRAKGRINWIIGAGGRTSARLLAMMYERGHTGPLWEMRAR